MENGISFNPVILADPLYLLAAILIDLVSLLSQDLVELLYYGVLIACLFQPLEKNALHASLVSYSSSSQVD